MKTSKNLKIQKIYYSKKKIIVKIYRVGVSSKNWKWHEETLL